MKNHIAMYGVTKIKRGYCKKCKEYAFIIDKTFSCCYEPDEEETDKYKRMSETTGIRKKPSQEIQRRLLLNQNNQCKYCGIKFGELYFKGNKTRISRLHWDHLVPFVYLQENPYNNWVASCNVCNEIKSSKMFDTIQEVRDYVIYQRRKKGIYYQNESLPSLRNDDEKIKEESNIL